MTAEAARHLETMTYLLADMPRKLTFQERAAIQFCIDMLKRGEKIPVADNSAPNLPITIDK